MGSLVVTVDDDTPVVISASPGATDIGLISWTDPAIIELNDYAPEVRYLNWSTSLGFRRQQTLASFVVAPFGATNESEADALIEALRTSLRRVGYELTREKNGVTKTYLCDAGSVTPAGETTRLTVDRPQVSVWNVAIPCSVVS